jgi:hypothetical protein
MSDLDDDLHATADAIAHDAAAIAKIEEQKTDLPATDPEVVALSAESRRLARRVLTNTDIEAALAKEARDT